MGRYKLTRQRQPFYDLFGNSKCGGIQDNYLQQSDGEHVPTKIPAWSRSTLVCPQPMLRQTSPNFYMGRPWSFSGRLWLIFMPFQHVYQRDDENYPVWQDGYCHRICWGASAQPELGMINATSGLAVFEKPLSDHVFPLVFWGHADRKWFPIKLDGIVHRNRRSLPDQLLPMGHSSRWKVNARGWFFPLIRYFPCSMTDSTSLETLPLPKKRDRLLPANMSFDKEHFACGDEAGVQRRSIPWSPRQNILAGAGNILERQSCLVVEARCFWAQGHWGVSKYDQPTARLPR